MLRSSSTTEFVLNGFRWLRATPDRLNCWTRRGEQPEIEVFFPHGIASAGWAVLSFDLHAEGAPVDRCWLLSISATERYSVELLQSTRRNVVVWLSEAALIRLRLDTQATVITATPVSLRSIGAVEARLRMLAALLRARSRDWRWLLALARRLGGVIRPGGVHVLAKWIVDEYRIPYRINAFQQVVTAGLNLFDDVDVAEASGLLNERFIWIPQDASEINDLWSAARYCIDLLRRNPQVRQRFPNALSYGEKGAFAHWIEDEGARLFCLSLDASTAIRRALGADLSKYVRQLYLVREDLQQAFPLALTPAGRRDFFSWILDEGKIFPGVRLETIWWFFLECDEDPAGELVRTLLFRPQWQSQFPDGATVFGREAFAKWLAKAYGLDGDWMNPTSWPAVGTAAEHIRLTYALRPEWQRAHPESFKAVSNAEAFLQWLELPDSKLTENSVAWCKALDKHAVAKELTRGGVNILGHFCYASGLRSSVESLTECMRRAGLGVSLRDIWQDYRDEPRHAEFSGLEFYDTTIIHTQPEPYFEVSYERAGVQPRDPRTYRIGYWYWEFEEVPQSWVQHAAQLDELWAATEFVASAMRKRLEIPVFHIMPGIELPNFVRRPRTGLGLPDETFIFLFVFNMMSVMERKNPLGLIEAYRRAFGSDNGTLLVIKTSFGDVHSDLLAQLHAAAGDGVLITDAIYSQEETLSLMAAADCYISLHRSEGWGLTMAEAMLLGKPTIATRYSGNIDFMTPANSLLVEYDLVHLEKDYPPYKAGSRWANPSVDHAAQLMRQVFENQQWARELGQRAQADLSERMSPMAAGQRMAARLNDIRRQS